MATGAAHAASADACTGACLDATSRRSIGAGTRQLFRARVEAGPPPGLLAYWDGASVGWVQVGPRADVPGWNGARRLTAPTAEAPADNPRVWGISCFVTKAGYRRQGIATALLAGAVNWAGQNGARVLDACPVDASAYCPPVSLYHGLASTFRRAGFRDVARRRPDRPLMRLVLSDQRAAGHLPPIATRSPIIPMPSTASTISPGSAVGPRHARQTNKGEVRHA